MLSFFLLSLPNCFWNFFHIAKPTVLLPCLSVLSHVTEARADVLPLSL